METVNRGSADLALVDRLIRGAPWKEYLKVILLPYYLQVSHALDTAKDDHRYLQGMKEGLRMVIEKPYLETEQPSPLGLLPKQPQRRPRATETTAQQQSPSFAQPRQSYLA